MRYFTLFALALFSMTLAYVACNNGGDGDVDVDADADVVIDVAGDGDVGGDGDVALDGSSTDDTSTPEDSSVDAGLDVVDAPTDSGADAPDTGIGDAEQQDGA